MIKIDGIYDEKVWKALGDIDGVTALGVDFWPKSFNFLQGHRFQELLQQYFKEDVSYLLHFREEKDFVIQKIVDDTQMFLGKHYDGVTALSRVFLEFSGTLNFSFFDSFEMGYFVHYDSDLDISVYDSSRFVKGIIFSYEHFEMLHTRDRWSEFLAYYNKVLLPFIKQRRLKTVLKIDWNDNLFPSLIDSIKFDLLNFEINPKVEVSYRQLDIALVKKTIELFKKEVV